MSIRAVLTPLVSGSTYRRGVFLLLGGVLLLPYLLLASVFGQMLVRADVPRSLVGLLMAVAAVIGTVPLFLGGARALEITAARSLLGVDLPDPAPGHPPDRETRLRAALWIATHLAAGGLVMFGLISALPMALVFVAQQLGLGADVVAGQPLGPLTGYAPGRLAVLGALVLVARAYAVAGLGALARLMAPVL
ncbi:two-component sensor histidine kinase, partial [Micromonospora zhanjiangensis]